MMFFNMRQVLAIGVMMAVSSVPVHAAYAASTEYLVKAAVVYRFTKFVKWPESVSEFHICVRGENPFNGALKKLEERSSGSFRYAVHENPPQSQSCHLTYYTLAAADQLSSARKNTLTVGEGEAFTQAGGMVGLTMTDKRVKFVVNLREAKKHHLSVSPQLLEIAEKVIR